MKISISFLLALLTAAQCLGQTFSSWAVFVTEDESGKPIASASVTVKESGWTTKTTGSDGKIFFDKSMPIGEIHYIASKEGYQGVEGTFNITTEEKSNSLNVKLFKFRDDRLLITGEVVDEDDKDIEGAIVEVKIADILKTTQTDESGNYSIELILNSTQYETNSIRLEVKCGDSSNRKVEIIDLTRKNIITKNFKLSCPQVNTKQLSSRTRMVIELAYNSYLIGFVLNSNIDLGDDPNYAKVIKAYEDDIINSVESLKLKRDSTKTEHENFINYKKALNSKEDQELLEFGLNLAILQTLIYSMPHLKEDYKQKGYETYISIYNEIKDFLVNKQKAELIRFIPNIDSKEGDCHKIIQEYILSTSK